MGRGRQPNINQALNDDIAMPNGYHGAILHVDLTQERVWVEHPDEAFYRTYMGGSNFGLYYVLRHTPPGADPLGPDNVLAMMTSPLTGLPFSGQSRAAVNAKSPLTGAIGDSQAGGFFPVELKATGFDGLVVYGKANRPVYLWLHDGKAEIRDAGGLWGRGTAETEALIRAELGDDKIEVACIGPAGENLVRFAAIINMANRAWGRTGMGAVMGSKNLKAIAVRGRQRAKAADAKTIKRIAGLGAKAMAEDVNADIWFTGVLGTASVVLPQNTVGGLPTRNYTCGEFAGADAISGERMSETILADRDTCYACVVRCKRVVEVEDERGFRVEKKQGGPEYETLSTFGSYCGVDDLNAIALANAYCNDLGLDTISCGATVAWAMECFEAGLLSPELSDGLDLCFGNGLAMAEAVRRLAHRQGRLGDLLAEGSARAARRLGPEAEARVVAVKGSELPAHMPQVKRSLALIYAVHPFGADHQSSEHDPYYEPGATPLYLDRLAAVGLTNPVLSDDLGDEKVRFALTTQTIYSLLDVLCLCQFDWGPSWQLYGSELIPELVQAATGWDVTLDEIITVGARRLNMLAAFNAREGFTRADDKLPPRLFEPLVGGLTGGLVIDKAELERAMDSYYAMAGWDVASGRPKPERLQELGLGWTEAPAIA
jgi:aldehyde:ferredoxin oxidoreductase